MKRKAIAVLLSCGMVLGAGCANKAQAPAPATEAPAATEEAVEEVVEEAPVEEEEPSEAEEEEIDTEEDVKGVSAGYAIPPEFYSIKDNRYEANEDYSIVLFHGYGETLQLTEDSADIYPELNKAMQLEAEEKQGEFDSTANQMLEDAKEMISENPDMDPEEISNRITYEKDIIMKRCDEYVTSYYENWYQDGGGAHGNYGCYGVNFDNYTGQKLTLEDILTDTSSLQDILKEKLEEAYTEPNYFMDDLDVLLADYDPTLTESAPLDGIEGEDGGYAFAYDYALSNEGLEFYFAPYALAPYAMGAQQVTIGYDEYRDLFNEDYLPYMYVPIVTNIQRYSVSLDLNGDGTKDAIGVDYAYNDDYSEVTGLKATVTIDGNESSAVVDSEWLDPEFDLNGYFMQLEDGRQYIYAVAEMMNDYQDLYIFDVTGGDVKSVSNLTITKPFKELEQDVYGEYLWVHPDHLVIGNRFDMMSTFNAGRVYFVGKDGMPDTNQEYYYVLTDAAYEPLTAKEPIPCIFVDEVGEAIQEDCLLSPGETFWNYRTNGEGIYDVKLEDGTIARLMVDQEGKIDGTAIDELVEQTYYAG